jgi:Protein of unknown function (DUF2911)
MKIPVSFLFLIIFLSSCNGNKEKNDHAVTTGTTPDTSTLIKAERAVNPYAPVDISPMDMSYYPADYPKLKMADSVSQPPFARIVYSRPHLQGRKLFTDVLKYGEPWRLGANEATELDLYSDATIQDKKIKAGRYILYCIPQQDKWTIVLNSNIDSWGLHPDSTKDIAKFTVPSRQTGNFLEYFTMVFEKTGNHVELVMAWESVEARLPISF